MTADRNRWRGNATFAVALTPSLLMGAIAVGHRVDDGAGDSSLWHDAVLSSVLRGLAQTLPLMLTCVGAAVLLAAGVAWRTGRTPRQIGDAALAAVLFALTLPASTSWTAAAISIAFGWIVGREIFGSARRSFVHPAVLGHVFLTLAWPKAMGAGSSWAPASAADVLWPSSLAMGPVLGALGAASVLACLAGGVVVVARGLGSWRVMLAVPVGAAVALAVLEPEATIHASLLDHLVLGNLTFGAVFLAGLAGSSPETTSGQWFHGALVGGLVILFRLAVPTSPDGTLSAILLASIFAPLADEVVRFGRQQRASVGNA